MPFGGEKACSACARFCVQPPNHRAGRGRHTMTGYFKQARIVMIKKNGKESQSFTNYLEILLREKKKRVSLRSRKLGFSIRAHKGCQVWSHRDLKQSRHITVHEEKQVEYPGHCSTGYNFYGFSDPLGTGDGTRPFLWIPGKHSTRVLSLVLQRDGFISAPLTWAVKADSTAILRHV